MGRPALLMWALRDWHCYLKPIFIFHSDLFFSGFNSAPVPARSGTGQYKPAALTAACPRRNRPGVSGGRMV